MMRQSQVAHHLVRLSLNFQLTLLGFKIENSFAD